VTTTCWHVITGEYPPQSGGVADHTALIARGLAEQGCAVHVWCPAGAPAPSDRSDGAVSVHRVTGAFLGAGLHQLDRARSEAPPGVLLVQYAPNALGMRGLNLPFCLWLVRRARQYGDDVRVMFHEPYFYFCVRRPQRNVLALAQRVMAVLLLAASRVVYVSSERWVSYLRPYSWAGRRPILRLPVPSAVPYRPDAHAVVRRRSDLFRGRGLDRIVAHFGTFGDDVVRELEPALRGLLARDPRTLVYCLGRNSERFVSRLRATCADGAAERVVASGVLDPDELSIGLQACDVVVQPYPDGVTTRRTSLMAALANGVPAVTTAGRLTEAIWTAHDAVALTPVGRPQAACALVVELLADEPRRRGLGERGQAFYREYCSVSAAMRVLLPVTQVIPPSVVNAG
jgi:glycosyltransferase involved in cell wall biosynthesis